MRKLHRTLAREFDAQISVTGKNHLRIDLPNGRHVICANTPKAGPEALKKVRQQVKRKQSAKWQETAKAAYAKLIEHFGSESQLAAACGITRQSLHQCKGILPVKYVRQISELTGVRREELRPDIYAP